MILVYVREIWAGRPVMDTRKLCVQLSTREDEEVNGPCLTKYVWMMIITAIIIWTADIQLDS